MALVCATVRADEIDEALGARFLSYDARGLNTMVLDDAVARVVRADLSAEAAWADAKSLSELAALRARLRAAMITAVGGRTRIQYRVTGATGTLWIDGVLLERVD